MARNNLEIAPNCKGCKLFELKCSGAEVIKGGNLHCCPSYIKIKSTQIIKDDIVAPYPIIKKVKKRGRKT